MTWKTYRSPWVFQTSEYKMKFSSIIIIKNNFFIYFLFDKILFANILMIRITRPSNIVFVNV